MAALGSVASTTGAPTVLALRGGTVDLPADLPPCPPSRGGSSLRAGACERSSRHCSIIIPVMSMVCQAQLPSIKPTPSEHPS